MSQDRKVVGMVTDRDISIALATRGLTADGIAVKDVATGTVYTCAADEQVTSALETMKTRRVRRLPIVDAEGRLTGILSMNDIVLRAGAASPRQIVDALGEICEHRVAVKAA